MKLDVLDLKFTYGSKLVLENVNMQAALGKITVVVGPNASGKTTLLKCVGRLLKPKGGRVLLNGKKMSEFTKEDIEKYVSYLPQEFPTAAVLTVFETVLLGRLHSLSWRVSDMDLQTTLETLESLGISELSSRFINTLSGGQKQMVFIAQTLARKPKILLLDEPASNLDVRHQLEILGLIRDLTLRENITTILVLHDLNLAARYSDELVVMHCGKVYANGPPRFVLTEKMLKVVYGVNAKVNVDDEIPQITPISPVGEKLSEKNPMGKMDMLLEPDRVKKEIKEYWDRNKRYDNHFTDDEIETWKKFIHKEFGGGKKRIIDIGTGTGFLLLPLVELKHDVIGVDFSEGMLSVAKNKAERIGIDIDVRIADAESLEFDDGTFDVVVTRWLLWTLPHPEKALSEWFRILKPCGQIYAFDTEWRGDMGGIGKWIKRNLGKFLISIIERRNSWKDDYSDYVYKHLPLSFDSPSSKSINKIELFRKCGFKDVTIFRLDDVNNVLKGKKSPLRYKLAWGGFDFEWYYINGSKPQ